MEQKHKRPEEKPLGMLDALLILANFNDPERAKGKGLQRDLMGHFILTPAMKWRINVSVFVITLSFFSIAISLSLSSFDFSAELTRLGVFTGVILAFFGLFFIFLSWWRRLDCLLIAAIVCAMLLTFLFGGLFVAPGRLNPRGFYDTRVRWAMHEFGPFLDSPEKSPVGATWAPPEDYFYPPLFSDEILKKATAFRNEWMMNKAAAQEIAHEWKFIKENSGLCKAETFELAARLSALQPLVGSYRTLVMQSDYTIDALTAGMTYPETKDIPVPNLLAVQLMSQLLEIEAAELALAGEAQHALEICGIMMRGAQTEEYTRLISRLVGISVFRMALAFMQDIVVSTHDAEVLRAAMVLADRAAEIRTTVSGVLLACEMNFLQPVREATRYGTEVSGKEMTAREFIGQWRRVTADYKAQFILPLIPEDDLEGRADVLESIQMDRELADFLFARTEEYNTQKERIAMATVDFIIAALPVPSTVESNTRSILAKAEFDLLRILIALRLYELEQGGAPERLENLVPDYLPIVPMDLFSADDAPYFYRPGEMVYSLGPDGIDQGGNVIYDPSNGTVSAGDIVMALGAGSQSSPDRY